MAAEQPTGTTFRLETKRLIPAPVAEVYAAWTNPELFPRWFRGPTKQVSSFRNDPRPGGTFEIVLQAGGREIPIRGEYLEVDPPRRLVFTWISVITGNTSTRVSLDFRERETDTELTLLHEFFPTEKARDGNYGGWGEVLDGLTALFAGA